jgi:hypothetical protein
MKGVSREKVCDGGSPLAKLVPSVSARARHASRAPGWAGLSDHLSRVSSPAAQGSDVQKQWACFPSCISAFARCKGYVDSCWPSAGNSWRAGIEPRGLSLVTTRQNRMFCFSDLGWRCWMERQRMPNGDERARSAKEWIVDPSVGRRGVFGVLPWLSGDWLWSKQIKKSVESCISAKFRCWKTPVGTIAHDRRPTGAIPAVTTQKSWKTSTVIVVESGLAALTPTAASAGSTQQIQH